MKEKGEEKREKGAQISHAKTKIAEEIKLTQIYNGSEFKHKYRTADRKSVCSRSKVRNKTTKSQINRLRYENIQSDEDEDNEDEHEDIEKDEKANSYEKMDGAGNTDAEKKSHSYSKKGEEMREKGVQISHTKTKIAEEISLTQIYNGSEFKHKYWTADRKSAEIKLQSLKLIGKIVINTKANSKEGGLLRN
ncbi:hypothetical protein SUGI_0765570 [Cryptomeria japonica]|nr:hypothetical protein SUGI_0765570 [Cryptomeria japonica]